MSLSEGAGEGGAGGPLEGMASESQEQGKDLDSRRKPEEKPPPADMTAAQMAESGAKGKVEHRWARRWEESDMTSSQAEAAVGSSSWRVRVRRRSSSWVVGNMEERYSIWRTE